MEVNIKKLFALLLAAMLLFCAACRADGLGLPVNAPRLKDISADQAEVIHVPLRGALCSVRPDGDGYFLLLNSAVTRIDAEGQPLWNVAVSMGHVTPWLWRDEVDQLPWDGTVRMFLPRGDGFTIVRRPGDGKAYMALGQNGEPLWNAELSPVHEYTGFFPDHAGGVYVLESWVLRWEESAEPPKILWHISAEGEVQGPESFPLIPRNAAASNGWMGEDGSYWLLVSGLEGESWLMRLDENFQVLARLDLRRGQELLCWQNLANNRTLLFSKSVGLDPCSFVYVIDNDCNLLHYETIVEQGIHSATMLRDGQCVVSFSTNRDAMHSKVWIYSADWERKNEINVDYRTDFVTALEDGGFAVVGERLAPGQRRHEYLMLDGTKDTVYSRYDAEGNLLCRKTFFAEDSADGYGFSAFATRSGQVMLLDGDGQTAVDNQDKSQYAEDYNRIGTTYGAFTSASMTD